ncbi:MAG: tRNA threonylcarbamoyladenosine dehydratase [Bacteroidales bacterium]|nr:tRNA threonylcarbamoyladenosine dehydratase [Bacteroidales bacterium]
MSTNWLSRTALLMGEEGVQHLQKMHVLVVGVGGVGAYAAEQLCRAGVGEMTIVDADVVEDSNRNRQLIALINTIGVPKVEVMSERLRHINPEIKLHPIQEFIRDERTVELLQAAPYDYVVDAIDSLSPKVFLIYHALQQNLRLVSAMGAGGKWDPTQVQVADIKKTYQCRLAHAIRKRLHKMGVDSGFKAVFSPEPTVRESVVIDADPTVNKLSTTGTISYLPAVFGCVAASVVIRDLLEGFC